MIATKNVKQNVVFDASPHEVYELLMDEKKHALFTGAKAKISKKVGESFSAYDGYIVGKNVELVPDKKIVQLWRASDWQKGYFSIVTFVLKEKKGKTELTFVHEGVPVECVEDISQGWKDHYWERMKEALK